MYTLVRKEEKKNRKYEHLFYIREKPQLVKFGFLTYPVEVMEDPQTFDGVQFLAAGVQFVEPAGNVIGNTVKEGLGLIHIFLVGGDGNVPLLHHAVGCVGDLVREHGVVFGPVSVQKIPTGRK